MKGKQLDPRKAIPVLTGTDYTPELAALRNIHASGVYIIVDTATREILYAGESHTGRLYDTITRHFRKWKRRGDEYGRKTGGTTYARDQVSVCFVITQDQDAPGLQYTAIQAWQPRDNQVEGASNVQPADPANPDAPAWL
jgi:hypothetical protein